MKVSENPFGTKIGTKSFFDAFAASLSGASLGSTVTMLVLLAIARSFGAGPSTLISIVSAYALVSLPSVILYVWFVTQIFKIENASDFVCLFFNAFKNGVTLVAFLPSTLVAWLLGEPLKRQWRQWTQMREFGDRYLRSGH